MGNSSMHTSLVVKSQFSHVYFNILVPINTAVYNSMNKTEFHVPSKYQLCMTFQLQSNFTTFKRKTTWPYYNTHFLDVNKTAWALPLQLISYFLALMCVHPPDLEDQQRGIYNLTYYGVTLTGYWGHLSEPGQGCNVALSTSSVFHVLDCLTLMPL